MKTREQIIEAIKNGKEPQTIDERDFARLVDYFPVSDWGIFGFGLAEGAAPPEPLEITHENLMRSLKGDLAFAFEKALNKRGISASTMHEVILMWLWVLDDPLQEFDQYAEYGLPLFKAVAVRYKFENPIGDDVGNEDKYSVYG